MKKLFGLIVCILLGSSFVYANTNFAQLLESKGMSVQDLMDAKTVKRSTVTELLNLVDCQDCHRPSHDMIGSLTQSRWTVFRKYPGNNFDDVEYNTSLVATNDYYCISYVANKGYMNGYPRGTSPVCSGKFCGENNITNADLIQTVFNITSKLFYSQYKADWLQISTWLGNQKPEIKQYFGLEDIGNIENGKKICASGGCVIDSVDALQTYVKYCTFEPAACSMQEFDFAKKGKRPIAEMNILIQQGIFTTDDIQTLNIEDFAVGSFIVDLLGRVKERSQCVDNDDQDNDGVKDYEDNCYITYNPRQTDTDQDKVGDVCDDDIDNDGVKNPVGIVDDAGNIVFDSIQNSQNLSEVLGLAIKQSQIQGNQFGFVAAYVGKLKDFTWDFGDGKTAKGIDVPHLYTTSGVYVVHLTAKDGKGNSIEAVSTVTVGGTSNNGGVGLSIKQDKTSNSAYNFSPIVVGNLTDFVWDFGDGQTGKGNQVSHTYTNAGTYTVRVTAKDTTGKTISAVSSVTITPNNGGVGLSIKQDKTSNSAYNFSPIVVGNLTDFVWDFGDGQTGKGNQVSHTYTNAGTYTVRVTAKDTTGKTVSATTQIIVVSIQNTAPRASLIPSKLVQNVGENVPYSIVLEGIAITDIDYVKLSFGDGRIQEIRGNTITNFSSTYTSNGKFLIEGTVYTKAGDKLPLAAYITVLPRNISANTPIDNCLYIVNPDQLDQDKNNVGDACDVNDPVGIRVVTRPITQDRFAFISQYSGSLKNFTWYFGDRSTGSGETALHTYRDSGLYTVRVEATTAKGTIVSATTSVTVGGPSISLVPSKLIQNVGEQTQYALQLNNLQVSDIDYVNIQWGDGRVRQIRGQDILTFVDTYNAYGSYAIGGTAYLNNNSTLAIGSYVTVLGQNFCLGNVGSSWQGACDLDKDTIPDICDTDIDGDGIPNPLGLIRFENKQCTYDGTNTNVNPTLSIIGTGTNANQDNCPFTANPDQKPCDSLQKDTDGDGILDIYDVCPAIPELFNGIEDTDGCPEYNFIVSFPSTKVQPGTCNICPCQYAQNDSALSAGDRVKAVLYDNVSQKPVAESTWYVVP